MMRTFVVGAAVLSAVPAWAQPAGERPPSIQVRGMAKVETVPDIAWMTYSVSGEGKTADDATRALAARHKAIRDGIADLLGSDTGLTTGSVRVAQARGPKCDESAVREFDAVRLSEGDCSVVGYVATIDGQVRTGAIDRIGTAIGLAGRLGARDAQLQGFQLADPVAAQRRAVSAAVADARNQAEAMAAGGAVRLGELLEVNDQSNRDTTDEIVVTGLRRSAPLKRAAPAPIDIDVKPRPIETRAVVNARFAIAR